MFTGARPSEVLGLTTFEHGTKAVGVTPSSLGIELADDLTETCYVEIEGLKGSDTRRVPIARDFYSRLHSFSAGTREYDPIFTITLRRLQQIWTEVKPCRKSLRSLRHTFALRSYAKVKDIRMVKTLLGHRNISNTMIYMDYFDSLRSLRNIL